MKPMLVTILSASMLIFGLAAVFAMLRAQGKKMEDQGHLVRLHRLCGFGFAILFMTLFVAMVWRVEDYWEESSSRVAAHVAMSLIVLPSLMFKLIIPRFFPRFRAMLFGLGILIYVLSFSLVMNTAGYFLIWRVKQQPYIYNHGPEPGIRDLNLGWNLFIQRCSTCHILDLIMKRRDPESWEVVVNQMVRLSAPRIKPGEASQILYFLSTTRAPISLEANGTAIERHCLSCHGMGDLLRKDFTRQQWLEVVKKMNKHDPDTVPMDKFVSIVDELVRLQDQPAPPQAAEDTSGSK